ncbi:MAG: hypothetical protein ACTSWE_04855 [Promethearchaeota archaeon]
MLIRKGYGIRIAIACINKDTSIRIPPKEKPMYSIFRTKKLSLFHNAAHN